MKLHPTSKRKKNGQIKPTLDMDILKFLDLPEFTYKGRIRVKGVGCMTLFWLKNAIYGEVYLEKGIKTVDGLRDYINSEDTSIYEKFDSFPTRLILENGLKYLQQVFSKYNLPKIKLIKKAGRRKRLSLETTIPEFLELPEFKYKHKDRVKGVGGKSLAALEYALYEKAYRENNIKTLGELIDFIQNKGLDFDYSKAEKYLNHVLSKYGLPKAVPIT
jgi:hypothetical protein